MFPAPKINNVSYDESCPIMDREQIDMLLMGDEGDTDTSLARELFVIFVEESAAKLEPLAEVCANGDALTLRKMVHFVAGSAGSLGLARLAAFYRGIERAIDEGQLTDLSGCEEPIRQEFEFACDAFRSDFRL